jgi:putative glutamine amidotransferase
VDIRLFSGEDNPAIGKPSPQRDQLEISLAKLAVESGWPVFGICRGIQVLNVALGGGLITDIPSQYKTSIQHATPAEAGRQFLAHKVRFEKKSLLSRIIKEGEIAVNSFHHQAIKVPAESLVVTARATDGLIEAVELPGLEKPVIGVQWHPENLQHLTAHKALFEAFIEYCR